MRKTYYILCFTGAFLFGFVALNIYNSEEIGARLPKGINESVYVSPDGNLWRSFEEFERHVRDNQLYSPWTLE